MLEAIKNGTLLFEIEFTPYPTPNHISPVMSLCILMFKLSVVFRLLKVSGEALKRFALRITQLYEQGADEDRIVEYVRHWCSITT